MYGGEGVTSLRGQLTKLSVVLQHGSERASQELLPKHHHISTWGTGGQGPAQFLQHLQIITVY